VLTKLTVWKCNTIFKQGKFYLGPMRSVFIFVIFLFAFVAHGQQNSFWQTLAEVGFEQRKDPRGYSYEAPLFSQNLRRWNGKKIKLKGYVIPVGEVGDPQKFMLSSLPFNVCYFCGAAGPETVVQVEADRPVEFTTKPVVMEGIIFLNDNDPDQHIYILRAAKILITQ
jgi:hypothetical protein